MLARAIRSLFGDHAIHSTGLGSCFSPTCRKAGILLAEKMLIKILEKHTFCKAFRERFLCTVLLLFVSKPKKSAELLLKNDTTVLKSNSLLDSRNK